MVALNKRTYLEGQILRSTYGVMRFGVIELPNTQVIGLVGRGSVFAYTTKACLTSFYLGHLFYVLFAVGATISCLCSSVFKLPLIQTD